MALILTSEELDYIEKLVTAEDFKMEKYAVIRAGTWDPEHKRTIRKSILDKIILEDPLP